MPLIVLRTGFEKIKHARLGGDVLLGDFVGLRKRRDHEEVDPVVDGEGREGLRSANFLRRNKQNQDESDAVRSKIGTGEYVAWRPVASH